MTMKRQQKGKTFEKLIACVNRGRTLKDELIFKEVYDNRYSCRENHA